MKTLSRRQSVQRWMLAALTCLVSALGPRLDLAATPSPAPRPLVGAIRFDSWQSGESATGDALIAQLGPQQWRYRLPSFGAEISPTTVRLDEATQANMDQEIALAKAAGIDYWAFNHYLSINRMCLNRYLSSTHKGDVKFCLQMGAFFDARAADAVNLMKNEPTYLTVAGGRPLVYVQTWYLRSYSPPSPKSDIDNFRARAIAAGLPNPYLVAQEFDAFSAAASMDLYGLDAIGTYAQGVRGPSHVEQSYPTLAANARSDWDSYAGTGRKVIPTVMTGWDPRPDAGRLSEPYFAYATPQQIATHLQDAINWSAANPGAAGEANTVLIYAWNEITEGGWLVPSNTAFNAVGNGRLDALAAVLGASPPSGGTTLLAWWKLDDGSGSQATDASGNGVTGNLKNGPVWAAQGRIGAALGLGGGGAYVDYGSSGSLNFAGGASFTMAAWVRTQAAYGTILSQRNVADGGAVIDLCVGFDGGADSPGSVMALVRQDHGTGGFARVTGGSVNDGAWHHVALVRSPNGRIELFLDGGSQGIDLGSESAGAITTTARGLGGEINWEATGFGTPEQRYLNGQLDDVRIYAGALSAAEIAALATSSGGGGSGGSMPTSGGGHGGCGATGLEFLVGLAFMAIRRHQRSPAALCARMDSAGGTR